MLNVNSPVEIYSLMNHIYTFPISDPVSSSIHTNNLTKPIIKIKPMF